MLAKECELFYNLVDLNYEEKYYDFHNDYNCIKILFENDTLILRFEHIKKKNIIELCFERSKIVKVHFDFSQTMNQLTIDNIYRGKFEQKNQLCEFSDNKSYFYITFCEDISIELFTEKITLHCI